MGHFCPPGSLSGFLIRMNWPDWIRIRNPDFYYLYFCGGELARGVAAAGGGRPPPTGGSAGARAHFIRAGQLPPPPPSFLIVKKVISPQWWTNNGMHLRVHTVDKPFGCSQQCKKYISKNGNLEVHLSMLTSEKPFLLLPVKEVFGPFPWDGIFFLSTSFLWIVWSAWFNWLWKNTASWSPLQALPDRFLFIFSFDLL